MPAYKHRLPKSKATSATSAGLERLGETRLTFVTRAQIKAESDASAEDASEPDEDLERVFAFYRALDLVAAGPGSGGRLSRVFTARMSLAYFEYEAEEITILREAREAVRAADILRELHLRS